MIFLSSVSRRFGPGSLSVELKYVRIIARFAYAMKEDIKNKNFVVRALKTKQVGNVFSLRGFQEKSGLGKVLMEEDKTPTKALYLNTGDKTKSKYVSCGVIGFD